MDHQHIPQQALYWDVPQYTVREEQVDRKQSTIKDLQKINLADRKQRSQLLTNRNVATWMRTEQGLFGVTL